VGSEGCLALMCFSDVRRNRQDRHLGPHGQKGQRPKSEGKLLGKSKCEKPLADSIMAIGLCFLRPKNHDLEAQRI
jgi:hypothetical protein